MRKPVNEGIRNGEIMSEEMSHLSSTNPNPFVLPQLSVQPVLPQDPAGKHRYQNNFRPVLISIDREMRKRRECPQLLRSAVCLVIVTTTDTVY